MPCYDRATCGLMPDIHVAALPPAFGMGAACDTLDDLMALSDDLFSPSVPADGLKAVVATPAAPAEAEAEVGDKAPGQPDESCCCSSAKAATAAPGSAPAEAEFVPVPVNPAPEPEAPEKPEESEPVVGTAEVDGTAGAEALSASKGKRKTRICRLWLENRCRRRRCPFAHGKDELRGAAGDEVCCPVADDEGAEAAPTDESCPTATSRSDTDTLSDAPDRSSEADPGASIWGQVLQGEGVAVAGRGPATLLGMCLAPDAAQQALRHDARVVLQGLLMGVDRTCTAKGAGASLEVGTFDSILDVVVEGGKLPWLSCLESFSGMMSARGIAARAFPERGEVFLFSHALGVVSPRYIESSFLIRMLFCPHRSGVVSSARREVAAIHSTLRGSRLHPLVPAILGVFRARLPASLFSPGLGTPAAPVHHDVTAPAMGCKCSLGYCPCSGPQRPGLMAHDPYAVQASLEPAASHDVVPASKTPSALAELCGLGQMERAVVVLFLAYVQHSRTHPNFDDVEWMFRSFFDFYAGLNFEKHVVRLHDRPFPPRAECVGEVAGRMEDGMVYIADLVTSANLASQLAASTLTHLFKNVAQSLRDDASLDTLVSDKLLERRNTVLFRPLPAAACAKQGDLAAALARVAACLQEPENAVHTGAVRAALLGAAQPYSGPSVRTPIAEQARALKFAMNSGLW